VAASGTADQTRSLWIHHAQSILQGNDGHSERLQTDFGLSNILRDGIRGRPADGLDCSPEALFGHYHRDLTISLVDQQQLPLALSGKGLRVDGVGLRKRAIAFYFGDGISSPGPKLFLINSSTVKRAFGLPFVQSIMVTLGNCEG